MMNEDIPSSSDPQQQRRANNSHSSNNNIKKMEEEIEYYGDEVLTEDKPLSPKDTTTTSKFFSLFQTNMTGKKASRRGVYTWFSFYYMIDWVLAACIFISSQIIFGTVGLIAPYQRYATFWYMNDPSISYPVLPSIVPTWALILFVFTVPTAVFILVQLKKRSWHDFHHAMLGLFTTLMLTMLFTDCFKLYAGRLRPDFLGRCQPDITGKCTSANQLDVRDGRLSFPSGHSSTSFAAMVFLSAYLCGKFKIFHVNGGQLWKVLIAISPIFCSGYIAISRTRDYHHNFDDILAGTVLGIAMGLFGYHLNYPSLFSENCELPKNRYYIHSIEMKRRTTRLETV